MLLIKNSTAPGAEAASLGLRYNGAMFTVAIKTMQINAKHLSRPSTNSSEYINITA
jgi:hypothetical protein